MLFDPCGESGQVQTLCTFEPVLIARARHCRVQNLQPKRKAASPSTSQAPIANYHLALIPVHDFAQATSGQGRSPQAGNQCVAGACLNLILVCRWLLLQALTLYEFLVHDFAQGTPGQGRSPQAGDQCVVGSMLESALCRAPVILMCQWLLLQTITLHYILFTTLLRPLQGKRGLRRRETSVW